MCAWVGVCVYSSLLGGRVTRCPEWIKGTSCDTAWKEHGSRQKERSLCSPERQKRQRQEAETTQSSHHLQWPSSCNKQDQGDRRRLSQPWPQVSVQAINSTLLSTQLISLSCRSSKLHDKKRADSKTEIKRWVSKDLTKKSSEQMLIDQRTENRRGQWWEKVKCVEGWSQTSLKYQLWPAFATDLQLTDYASEPIC